MKGNGMKALCGGLLALVAMAGFACAQSPQARIVDQSAKERLVGAWRLVRIESPRSDGKPDEIPQPQGMLIYTRDGHMSVQLMYPDVVPFVWTVFSRSISGSSARSRRGCV